MKTLPLWPLLAFGIVPNSPTSNLSTFRRSISFSRFGERVLTSLLGIVRGQFQQRHARRRYQAPLFLLGYPIPTLSWRITRSITIGRKCLIVVMEELCESLSPYFFD